MIQKVAHRAQLVHGLVTAGSVGAEIGVHVGDFSEELLRTELGKLYLVDAWQSYAAYSDEDWINREDGERNMVTTRGRFAQEIEAGRVVIVRDWSAQAALCEATERLDWVYIDANHRYEFALVDHIVWSHRLKPGGIIMGHDYIERRMDNYGVVRAVDDFCAKFGWEISHLSEECITSYALKKR